MSLNLFLFIINSSDFMSERKETERKEADRQKAFEDVLGMNKRPENICTSAYCKNYRSDRYGGNAKCKAGLEIGERSYCPSNNHKDYQRP